MRPSLLSVSLALCLSSAAVSAAPESAPRDLEQVVVTATRTERALLDVPNTVDVIDRARMDTLLVRDLAALAPSGGQERGYRAGTENLPGALGYAAALEEPEPVADWADLRARLDDAIHRSGGDVVAGAAPRHPAIGSYRMPGVAATAQLIRMDLDGIAVSAGSACASGSLKPSHVLRAMGWDEAATREVLRVSFGRTTTQDEVDRFIAAWRAIARERRGAFAA